MLRVQTIHTGVGGAPGYTSHYFAEDETSVQAQAAIDAVGEFWNTIRPAMNSAARVEVQGFTQVYDPATGTLSGGFGGTPVVYSGTNSGQVLPPATQGLLQLRTPGIIAGRQLRGRIFVPGLTESASENGVLDTETTSRLQNAADGLIAAGPTWVVWSRTGGQVFPVTVATVWRQFASMRSRRD